MNAPRLARDPPVPLPTTAPRIGVTPSIDLGSEPPHPLRIRVNESYLRAVVAAGGVPFVLHPDPALLPTYLDLLDGVLLTGGDDIDPSAWGEPLHPTAKTMHPMRQTFDFALLAALRSLPRMPVLGICLGMQEMGVERGCRLIQHLPDEVPTGADHADDRVHEIAGELGAGSVTSYHHQALGDPGPFEILARSHDGVIEALRDPARPFYLGVQWHPERTLDPHLGQGIIRQLVAAAETALARG